MEIELSRVLSSKVVQFDAKITPYVVVTCIMAASGGLMYGYDLVIAGGISIMDDFLLKFYPNVHREKLSSDDIYCKYNNQVFQLFTSSLYLAALFATFFASTVSRKFGRRTSMLTAGIFFIVGTVVGTSAQNLRMLITGRALLGCGIGFANQAVPVYLSEIAPPTLRGGLNLLFSVYVTVGVLAGNITNYMALNIHPWGWRFSLGLAGVPALLLTVCSVLVVESPSSLLERGHFEQAKWVLRRIRGSQDIDAEFDDLLHTIQAKNGQEKTNPFRELLSRRNRPQLVVGCALPFFQQVAGNDAILFYGTFLFKTAGFGDTATLYSAVIIGATGFLTCCVTVFIVDKVGRRRLLLLGSIFMCTALVVMASVFGTKLRGGRREVLVGTEAAMLVAMVCMFVIAFTMSVGPLAWLVPSEVYAQKLRSVGQSATVAVNVLFKFLIAQTFLSMLCAFKFAIFLFFASWVLLLGAFTLLFLPETNGLPLHKLPPLWHSHWFWKRYYPLPT